ncbi:MAG: glycosyltransferase family 4 protein [Thermoplasmata archaeon]|nr:glycosyltransferase family 4 protein [Thermoplasmata archaeon]
MPGKHVLMLLSNPFRPDPRVHKEARSLIQAGYRVTILCWDREQKHPKNETIDGIQLIRLGPESSFENSKVFVKTLRKFWKEARKEMAAMKFDLIHAHDLDTLAPAVKEARKRKIPIIYDSHEIYHEMAGERLSGFMVRMLRSYEKRMVKKPDALITVNEKLEEVFKNFGAKNTHVIMNCHLGEPVNMLDVDVLEKKLGLKDKKTAMYIGVLEPNRQLIELAKAHVSSQDDFILIYGGYGSLEPEIKKLANSSNGRLIFLGRIPPNKVPIYNELVHVLIATYDPRLKNNRLGAPNKLFESMAAGRPIIVSEGTYAAQVIKSTGSGLTANYNGKAALVEISKLLADAELYSRCAKAGRLAFESNYNWLAQEKKLLAIYSKLLK